MTEGYGQDFAGFDKITASLLERANEKWGKHSYHNWCPFRSPRGALMAFHMKSYSDLRVVNMDTMEIVMDGDFYSHIHRGDDGKPDYRHAETVYAHHTNASIWVPPYIEGEYTNHEGKQSPVTYNAEDFDGDESVDDLRSIPLAFNAWTIWAADYEFYVDVLDLSRIDDGVVTLLELGDKFSGACIPISARHVRNFVKASAEHWIQLADKEKGTPASVVNEVTFDAHILTEHHLGRMDVGSSRGFHDIYVKDKSSYLAAQAPWIGLKERMAERKAVAAAKE